MFFNISGGELLVVVLVIFLLFGPDKIPEIARFLGKSVNEIKRASMQIKEEIQRETSQISRQYEELKKESVDDLLRDDQFHENNPDDETSNSHLPPNSVPVDNPYRLDAEDTSIGENVPNVSDSRTSQEEILKTDKPSLTC